MMNMHRAEFRAALQRGYGLAGIEQAGRIERSLDRVKLAQLGALKLHTHLIDFLHAPHHVRP